MDSTVSRPGPATTRARNAPGLASLICAAVAVVLSAVLTLGQAALLSASAPSPQQIGLYDMGRALLITLLGAAALVLGVVGLVGARPQKPVAAAGLAVGASLVLSGVVAALHLLLLALAG